MVSIKNGGTTFSVVVVVVFSVFFCLFVVFVCFFLQVDLNLFESVICNVQKSSLFVTCMWLGFHPLMNFASLFSRLELVIIENTHDCPNYRDLEPLRAARCSFERPCASPGLIHVYFECVHAARQTVFNCFFIEWFKLWLTYNAVDTTLFSVLV